MKLKIQKHVLTLKKRLRALHLFSNAKKSFESNDK